jgi:hypothetical protein
MWRLPFRLTQPVSVFTADRAKTFWNFHRLKYALVPVAGTSLYCLLHRNSLTALEVDSDNFEHLYDQAQSDTILETAKYILRFL